MEQWEIDLRARLEVELKEGSYDISGGNLIMFTGKQGYIEYRVKFQKIINKMK